MTLTADAAYVELISEVLTRGETIRTRNAEVKRIFDVNFKFTSTPLVTLRKTSWKTALREWEWFMGGSDNINDLHESVRPWWSAWANNVGRVFNNYSKQFRRCAGEHPNRIPELLNYDQIAGVIESLIHHPFSRRNVITTWNSAEMAHESTPITNCHHTLTQFFVDTQKRLHMKTYQRSVDVIVGLPANWVQTWGFLKWLAHRSGLAVGTLSWTGGDIHIYPQHFALARRILAGEPLPSPELVYSPTSEDFFAADFSLDRDYTPSIVERAEMVV